MAFQVAVVFSFLFFFLCGFLHFLEILCTSLIESSSLKSNKAIVEDIGGGGGGFSRNSQMNANNNRKKTHTQF